MLQLAYDEDALAVLGQLLGRLRLGLVVLGAVLALGTFGYQRLEGWSLPEALYATLLVVSTLGFGRQLPATGAGQGLTSALIIGGVGTLFYLLSSAAETVIEASLGVTQARQMERTIAQMQRHHIVCGFGRVGRTVAQELAAQDEPFVIIDAAPAAVAAARAAGWAAIEGDATADQVLQLAGIARAGGLLLTTASDATNVFIALAARIANERLRIVARASNESSIAKLEKAGADQVIAPSIIGGQRMAAALLRPGATELMETLLHADDTNHWLEQTTLAANSPLCHQTIGAAQIRERTGVQVLAIRRASGERITNPDDTVALQPGDTLVGVGDGDELAQLAALARPEPR